MSTTWTTPAMNPQKRKRTVVSYAELDQLPDLFTDDDDTTINPCDASSGDESENDDRTYSRNKKKPKKAPKKKKAKHAQKAEKPFPFMQLPPELRDMIYEYALTEVDGVGIATKTKAYRRTVCRAVIHDEDYNYRQRQRYMQRATGRGKPQRSQVPDEEPKPYILLPNILAVSKQIHHEAVNILYGQHLKFHDADALHRFLTIIGPRNQKRLHSVEVISFCTGRNKRTLNHCAFMSLAGATNLKTLRINMADFRGYNSTAMGFARNLYGNAHFFLEAYGVANGRRDAAIDIIQIDDEVFDRIQTFTYRRGTFPRELKEHTFEENKVLFRAELCRLLGAN